MTTPPVSVAKRVLMLTERFPPEYTGAGRQLLSLAPRLSALGVSVEILTSCGGTHDRVEECDGIRVYRLALSEGPRHYHRFALRAARWFWGHRRHLDILHIHGISRAAFFTIPLAALAGKKCILKFTMAGDEDPAVIRSGRAGALKLAVLGWVRRYVCTSTALVHQLEAAGWPKARIVHIPNGVDIERFAPLSPVDRAAAKQALCRKLGWPPETLLVMFSGGIEERKGSDILIEAWPAIMRAEPNARLVLLGPADPAAADPEFVARMKRRLEEANILDTVRFTGLVADPETYLRASDVFAFPSRKEGLPNALIEAQAAGVACVAADLPGITDDVVEPDQTGYIVPQNDPGALAQRVTALLKDGELNERMRAAARDRAVRLFDLDAVAKRYKALYEELGITN